MLMITNIYTQRKQIWQNDKMWELVTQELSVLLLHFSKLFQNKTTAELPTMLNKCNST